MRLLEYQGKEIFEDYDIPVPKNYLARNKESLKSDFNDINLLPGIVKAQVPVGGRGKAGAVRKVDTLQQAQKITRELLDSNVKGHPVEAVLLEEQLDIERELYVGFLLNKSKDCITAIASSAGGVDIEQVAEEKPGKITQIDIDPAVGLQDYMIRYLAKRVSLKGLSPPFKGLLRSLYKIFLDKDATMVEINPLAQTSGELTALDSKILLDDAANYRHQEHFSKFKRQRNSVLEKHKTKSEQLADKHELDFVQLGGNIGLISDGAGTGMLTLDEIADAGGEPANFCEMGGEADAKVMEESIGVVLANPNVEGLLITLIGGLTRMDEMAEGIVNYVNKHEKSIPFVIRMCGTKEKEGKSMLSDIGINTFDDHRSAVEAIVEKVKDG